MPSLPELSMSERIRLYDLALEVHNNALDKLRKTMYEDSDSIKELHNTLGMTVFIMDAIDTVKVLKPEHIAWLEEQAKSIYDYPQSTLVNLLPSALSPLSQ